MAPGGFDLLTIVMTRQLPSLALLLGALFPVERVMADDELHSRSTRTSVQDGWRRVSKEARIPLTAEWQEHTIEFEIKTSFKDETTLRFSLPRAAKATFDLADPRLKRIE
jgi:hypothetical protein